MFTDTRRIDASRDRGMRHDRSVPGPEASPLYCQHMDFTRDELVWINNALSEVLTGGPAIEKFHTRIGGDREEVRALLGRVHDEVSALRRADPEW
ncbi:hypothetical protein [Mumia quercus]|uniref:hypothetical protein n=1 Tax=Mumia quercus TaxID=2976125 RepID=UPI0021CE8D27|nr:hypothetical protein [Mumia quercus]